MRINDVAGNTCQALGRGARCEFGGLHAGETGGGGGGGRGESVHRGHGDAGMAWQISLATS